MHPIAHTLPLALNFNNPLPCLHCTSPKHCIALGVEKNLIISCRREYHWNFAFPGDTLLFRMFFFRPAPPPPPRLRRTRLSGVNRISVFSKLQIPPTVQPMNLELYGAEQGTYYENFSVLLPFARADCRFDWWITP